jgi:hypothetical protein
LTTGSCFADAIGERLIRYKFSALANPFGATYNPLSIHQSLADAIKRVKISDGSFVKNDDAYFNYNYHSQWASTSIDELKTTLSNLNNTVAGFLQTATTIMITYGTAWVYNRRDTNEVVANCHKIPSTGFQKHLLTEEQILSSFEKFYGSLRSYNKICRIILTVSPVRHIKDTLELNSLSKAILRTACHKMANSFGQVEYFPAYEIMMDDLRDYRFYKSDMIHPTEDAENYIWQRFAERYFDDATQSFLKNWDNILSALNHKPFQPTSAQHQRFLKETLEKLKAFKTTVDVSAEINRIASQII